MSVQIIARVQQIMDCLVAEQISPLVAANNHIEFALACLGDADSRAAYSNELVFTALRRVVGDAAAHSFANDVNAAAWESAVKLTAKAIEEHKIPVLTTSLAPTHPTLMPLYTSVFTLNAAAHGDAAPHKGDVMLDVGAQFGETAVWAIGQDVKTVYAFEAGADAFKALKKNASTHGDNRISPVQAVVAAEEGSYRVDGKKPVDIPMITLDAWCKKQKVSPNFIRINLTGALSALMGSKETIKKVRPRMAINIGAHLPDMWQVPLVLKDWVPEYRMACRKNSVHGGFFLYVAI